MTRQLLRAAPAAFCLALLGSCGGEDIASPPPIGGPGPVPTPSPTPSPTPPPTVTLAFDFTSSADGWSSGFADYSPATMESGFAFASGPANVPPGVGGRGFLLGANNLSDDLLMYLWREAGGLVPGRRYRVEAEIRFVSNVGTNCVGIGGSPGQSVFIKAGANEKPVERALTTRSDGSRVFAVDVDTGRQGESGSEAVVIGDFANPSVSGCGEPNAYAVKTVSTGGSAPVLTADAQGRLFPFMATDSGFEGRTEIYWLSGTFTFVPQ